MCLLIILKFVCKNNCFLVNRKNFFDVIFYEISLFILCVYFISFILLYIFGGIVKVVKIVFVVGKVCIGEV